MAVQIGRVDDLDLHGGIGLAVALLADRPRIHLLGHMPEGRNLAQLIQILFRQVRVEIDNFGSFIHGSSPVTFSATFDVTF